MIIIPDKIQVNKVCNKIIKPIDKGWFKKYIKKEIKINIKEKNIFKISKNSL